MAVINTVYRSMAGIKDRPSSARILNLLEQSHHVQHIVDQGEYEPFFENSHLNRAIFLKHRLRPNEDDVFDDDRTVGTKIFLAFNDQRLEEGGKYIFVDQRGVEVAYHENFGMGPDTDPNQVARDIFLLQLIDGLPSLDPFLLRERLRLEGYTPHEAYFDLNPAEYRQIRDFVEREFTPLAELAFEQNPHPMGGGHIERLVDKMWDSRDTDAIRPLINSLQISVEEAPKVLFSWKGFIYYKSSFGAVKQAFEGFQNRVRRLKIVHFPNKQIELQIEDMRESTVLGMKREMVEIQKTLAEYDTAYKTGLIRRRDPKTFRGFLDKAPSQFYELGASIAAIKHAMSFWDYRFQGKNSKVCGADEFLDIMRDFRQGLRPDLLDQVPGES